MSKSWQQKREYVCKLVKIVSDHYGGDDPLWLEQYTQDLINRYVYELDIAIVCFEGLCIGAGIKMS